MKHFKLKVEYKPVPVADLCIALIPEKDYEAIAKAFRHALNDAHIEFDVIVVDGCQMVAKKKVPSFLVSE